MTNPSLRLLHPSAQLFSVPLFSQDECAALVQQGQAMTGWKDGTVVQKAADSNTVIEHSVKKYRSVRLLKALEEAPLYQAFHERFDQQLAPLCRSVYNEPFAFPGFINMLTYYPGDYHRPHRDVGPGVMDRLFTIVCYLNDEVEGGATLFPDLDVEVAPQTGHAIVFPSHYLHSSSDIVDGQKHALVCWLLKPPCAS